MNKNYTVIEDLISLPSIEDNNLIIVEDNEDTKKATVLDLKKSFSGDYKAVSDMTFYSSKKIEEYMSNIRRELSGLASGEELKNISKRIEDIITGSGSNMGANFQQEIIYARNGESTLDDRLELDIRLADDKFMRQVNKVVEGVTVSTGNFGYINVYLNNMTSDTANIIFKSKNKLQTNYSENTNTDEITYKNNGFIYKQLHNDTLKVSLKIKDSLPKGKYFLFTNVVYDDLFKDKGNIKFAVENSKDKSAYTEFIYNQSGKFEFEAPKAFNEITFIFNAGNFVANSTVQFVNMMLTTDDKYENEYLSYANYSLPIEKDETLYNCVNNDYDISCDDPSASIVVEYQDHTITANSMYSDIKELKSVLIDNRDKCGLIKEYGNYLFFDNVECKTPTSCRLSYDKDKYMRNGVPSLKMIFEEGTNVNPIINIPMTEYIENIDSVSLVFYVDRSTSFFFTSTNPITVSLCSDNVTEPEMVNYLYTEISKDKLVQGWNIIKKNISEFKSVGIPNVHGIKYARVEVVKNPGLDNRPIYFNSIVFNQKMKPTVLLAFDGIYEEGIGYTYPYLTSPAINMPATILANNRTTFDAATLNKIIELRAKYGWDIGQYACNPNKDLLNNDDNPREQYVGLKTTKDWLQNNLVYNPISYSVPSFGSLKQITVPILKDLGFKIAKTEASGYCNFFDPKYDFAIPMQLMSRDIPAEQIIDKIQYAIDNDCCICIYTNNVTNYGSEIDASKTPFEKVIKFIIQNKDKITPMTFSDFYNKCNE